MANLPESATWETGIYQLEETDPVQGGPNGIDNLQGKQLANRTAFLKALAESLGTGKLDLSALATQAEATAGTDNTKWMTPLRVAQAITALASIAAASETVAGKVELATVAETITGTDTVRATHPAGVKAAISAAVAAVLDSSPTTLDTLNELAAALGNDPNFATTVLNELAAKASSSSVNTWSKAQRGAVSVLADAATITPDFSQSNNYTLTLAGNRTLAAPSNMVAGQSGIITIKQDATGSRTLAFNSAWKFSGGSVPSLTTTANAVDQLAYYVNQDGTTIFASLNKDVK